MQETIDNVESDRSAAASTTGEPLSAITSSAGLAKTGSSANAATKSHMSNIFPTDGLVERYLEGKVLQNDGLIMIRNHRTLLRKDHESLADRVKILSGGPTRLEPLFSGCIGPGMLTGAVFGELASSPPHPSALAALRVLAKGDRAGVLVVVPNDPANRLNFGLACQEAAHEGAKTVCLTVGEDCSGLGTGPTGRRGGCGVAFLLKIAGAMAEEGRSIYEISCVLTSLKGGALGTVNVLVGERLLTVTSGARGESKSVQHHDSVTNAVSEALFLLFHPVAEQSLFVGKDDVVAVLVNNLGKMSDLHQALVVRELLALLNVAGVRVARLYSARLLNADEVGFSVSVLVASDGVLAWLDRPASAPGWPEAARVDPFKDRCLFLVDKRSLLDRQEDSGFEEVVGPKFTAAEALLAVDTLEEIGRAVVLMRDYLNALDADGEFGTNASKFALSVGDKLANRTLHVVSPHGLLAELAQAAALMGGAAGPVFAAIFCAAAQAFVASSTHAPVDWSQWMEAAASARDAVRAYTLARPGDATVLDALEPFAREFDAATPKRLSAGVRAAIVGAEANMDPAAYALAVALRIAFEKYRLYRMERETCDR